VPILARPRCATGTVPRPVTFEPVIPLERTFDALVGLEILEMDDERVRAQVPVREALKQPMGLVHGGVLATIAESTASMATFMAVWPNGEVAQGMANASTFLRPITSGTIHAQATRRHRGRTTWVWDVEISDDDGRLCAMSRMTIAVRPAPEGVRAAVSG
jgi:1,4-dihydroxy-2-naphthoyl-CoA hydrolase